MSEVFHHPPGAPGDQGPCPMAGGENARVPDGPGQVQLPGRPGVVVQLPAPYFKNSLEVPRVAVAHHQADPQQQAGPGRDIPCFRIQGEGGRY